MNDGGILGFKWLEDPKMFGLGCGDSSCEFVTPSGVCTNGGCRCADNRPREVHQFLMRNIAKLFAENQKLKLDLGMEEVLDDSR